LAAVAGSRAIVWASAAAMSLATVACYILALNGIPLIHL